MLVSMTLTQIRRDADVFGAGRIQPDWADLASFQELTTGVLLYRQLMR
jgi:hypothetical protein